MRDLRRARPAAGFPASSRAGLYCAGLNAVFSKDPVRVIKFELTSDHIKLCDLLKCAGVAGSGGQGKHLVAEGEVIVDGRPESRKTAKIRAGQVVECQGVRLRVIGPSFGVADHGLTTTDDVVSATDATQANQRSDTARNHAANPQADTRANKRGIR